MFKRPSCLQGRRHGEGNGDWTAFPVRQLFVLALCRICEPIAFMSIFPYVYQMVESFHVTDNDRKIALYAGMITSAFTFAEFSAGMFWGRMSDKIGRKPVLIMGLIGTAISMVVFGFAPNLPTAMIARALGGLLNGNIGVLQTTVAEIVTVKEHQPRAYSIMPFVWCLGSIIGPAMGGALAQPCDNYPGLFQRDTIFDRFPFLLPNLVCVVVLVSGIVVGLLFLEETHPEKKHRRDPGLALGNWLVAKVWGSPEPIPEPTDAKAGLAGEEEEEYYDYEDVPPPEYRSTESSPRLGPMKESDNLSADDDIEGQMKGEPCATPKAFTKQVIFNIIAYGILAYHSVSFDQLMPVFLSTPKSDDDVVLPFKFTGGLGLATSKIGFMLAVQGVYSMIAQLWLFPFVVRHFGTLRVFRFVLLVWPPLYLMVPYLILLPEQLQTAAAYVALISKITLHVIAFPATAILLANAAPSSRVLGSINGAAASTASLSRAFGPTVTGLLHSKGLESGYSVLAWWACGIVCILGAIESFWMEESERDKNVEKKAECDGPTSNRDSLRGSFTAGKEDGSPEEVRRLLSSARTSIDDMDIPNVDSMQANLNVTSEPEPDKSKFSQ